ncbi:MAG: hypothetical protein HKN04_12275 [Rhodothermaceae bacterium]|nr:hypothetical protein [Rhodothermaceae bacterium]
MPTHVRFLLPALLLGLTAGCSTDLGSSVQRAAERGAERAAERETQHRADQAVTSILDAAAEAIVCVITDEACIEAARQRGDAVILTDADGTPVNADGTRAELGWTLDFARQHSDGTLGYVSEEDDWTAIHLVNDHATNLVLVVPSTQTGTHEAGVAVLAFGRGERCSPADGTPVRVDIHPATAEWLVGSYRGSLTCEQREGPQPVSGTFQLDLDR